jgi:hypothetical protein
MPINKRKIFERDNWLCAFCGVVYTDGQLVVHHRGNRGMGGSKKANETSNLLSLCSLCNGVIEASSSAAKKARKYGIKLHNYELQSSDQIPVFFPLGGYRTWLVLDNKYGVALATDAHANQIRMMEQGNGLV